MPSGPKNHVNRHQAEARDREATRKAEANSAKARAQEDAEWADDGDKLAARRAAKAEAESAKRDALLAKKAEREAELLAEERQLSKAAVPTNVSKKAAQREVARAIRDFEMEQRLGNGADPNAAPLQVRHAQAVAKPEPLPAANPNLVDNDNDKKGGDAGGVVHASGVRAAVAALSGPGGNAEPVDRRHLGRRARVLYKQFCEERLEGIKAERPGLRRTQYNDVLWDLWQKAPENPFVQFNMTNSRQRKWCPGEDATDESDSGEEGVEGDAKTTGVPRS